MEPLMLAAATAVATTVMTKALEKTGEKLGEKVFESSEKFLTSLRRKPEIISAIEKVPQQPLDYGQAVLEVEALAKSDPEVAEAVRTLAATAAEDPDERLKEAINQIVSTLKVQEPTTRNLGKLAENIGLVVYGGGSVSIHNLNVGS
ncbi:hypothetical protein [Phormidium sp. FACHB-1136]|uniref:hypothetical protein n=1 Tax=Phormidium sp. FACHB-1136 TaxID=2692848 RepID=UPI001688D065|nr:hypothetical protein [Phormidium sp. FACHB-1136]MBD2427701.1 hypothetical protein [Phormidium sp. FACHB-1136]